MKTAKEIKEELENKHGWNFSGEENMYMYYELFLDVQKVVLRQPPVIGSVCTCRNSDLEKDSLVPVYCHACNAYVQTDL